MRIEAGRGQRAACPPRAIGALHVSTWRGPRTGATGIDRLRASGAMRGLSPRRGNAVEVILINTAGGLTGGDVLAVEARAGAGSQFCLTTQAAERADRAASGVTRMGTGPSIAEGACLGCHRNRSCTKGPGWPAACAVTWRGMHGFCWWSRWSSGARPRESGCTMSASATGSRSGVATDRCSSMPPGWKETLSPPWPGRPWARAPVHVAAGPCRARCGGAGRAGAPHVAPDGGRLAAAGRLHRAAASGAGQP